MIELQIWKLITGIAAAGIIAVGSITLVGALMAVACLREWYESRRSGE